MGTTAVVFDAVTQANIDQWLNGDYDEASKQQIRQLQQDNPSELLNAFYQHLSFGTGGLRGLMGIGTNRINPYTIQTATQGLANYIRSITSSGSVLIAYDCRLSSQDLAYAAARVLAANGIRVFIFKDIRPVPLVSFGVIHKKCTAGIMITASHNPPQYNGYKVYWSNGGQLLPPHEQGIIEQIRCVQEVKTVSAPHPLIEEIGQQLDQDFLTTLEQVRLYPQDNLQKGPQLHIIYSNLHGTGATLLPQALSKAGFTHVEFVKTQHVPDGNFPTVAFPNPEEPSALQLGIEQLQAQHADIFMATDPDADRLGVVVMHQNRPVLLSGNELACLATEHICHALTQTGSLPPRAAVVKTIVTSELMRAIAEHYGVQCLDVLTGFKYIGQKMTEWDLAQKQGLPFSQFIFGAEESYGYLLGTYARDKDAIGTAVLIAEMALHLKLQDQTLVDCLHHLYAKYGLYREQLRSMTFEGKQGAQTIQNMMTKLRETPPQQLAGLALKSLDDYQTGRCVDMKTGQQLPLLLPRSNVLCLWLEDGTKLVIRPSGTEPKVKIYCALKSSCSSVSEQDILHCDQRLTTLINELCSFVMPTT